MANQQVKGNQLQLEEDEEQQQIRGQKRSGDGTVDYQQQNVIQPGAMQLGVANVDRNNGQQTVNGQQRQRQAIQPQAIAQAEGFDPGQQLLKLKARCGQLKLTGQPDHQHQGQAPG